MIFRLSDDIVFPKPSLADADGLLAVGGDLSVERLILAYSNGIFPWFSDDDPILWYAPHSRCVIFPNEVHISRSMRRTINSNQFTITENKDFVGVISRCAEIARKGENGTWITFEMQVAYRALHGAGIAKSIEVWKSGELVGGIYGVVINTVFCGESMFSSVKDASKIALIWLCQHGGYTLIDCQIPNDHLLSMGARLIDSGLFRNYLRDSPEKSR